MIFLGLKNTALMKKLTAYFDKTGTPYVQAQPSEVSVLANLYDNRINTVVTDREFAQLPRSACTDILNSVGRRIPVIVVEKQRKSDQIASTPQLSDHVTAIPDSNFTDLLTTIRLFGNLETKDIKQQCQSIPYYNPQFAIRLLEDNGGLGILTIEGSGFNKLGVDYGLEVSNKVRKAFQNLLYKLWGQKDCFRTTDIICRKGINSNTYLIFMHHSRETGSLPHPGALEKVANRLGQAIQNSIWSTLFSPSQSQQFQHTIKSLPITGVGYYGILNNPCIDVHDILNEGIEQSKIVAVEHEKRVREHQREFMHTLIQSEELLNPAYQGIFYLSNLTEEQVKEAKAKQSIIPLADHIFGFESLIRINTCAISSDPRLCRNISPDHLNPDVIFSMAKSSKVALELDQTCIKRATSNAAGLPGTLMINILPRNLYYIDRLVPDMDGFPNIVFEVSESEAINNFDLLMKSRDTLTRMKMGIAADDFGTGYSSIDRIIKIRPNIIKFDRSIVENIHQDPVKQAYVKGLVKAGETLKTEVLAEGVEKWEEAVVLQKMGVPLIQGFLLHRPQNSDKILDDLATVAHHLTAAS